MNHTLKKIGAVKSASKSLTNLNVEKINKVLKDLATKIIAEKKSIFKANQQDLKKIDPNNSIYDRILITEDRLKSFANDLKNVANLNCPVGKILEQRTLPNGLKLTKVTVPLGVIGIIYEARPNVTLDVFALCLKSKNACVLKGGSDCKLSNEILVKLIREVLLKNSLNPDLILLLSSDRKEVNTMLQANNLIDVIIPRGGRGLIDFVRKNSTIPVIETGAGVVHIFIDEFADLQKAQKIIFNSKTRRPGVCNALDTLIIHQKLLPQIGVLLEPLNKAGVELRADSKSYQSLKKSYNPKLINRTGKQDFGTEFLSLKMSIKTVASLEEALKHIERYSSKHSEAIVSQNSKNLQEFLNKVDAAAVYTNAATSFTDGAQFGMGAEIGISTQKLHARGPMALNELTSYKWQIIGNGQTRNP